MASKDHKHFLQYLEIVLYQKQKNPLDRETRGFNNMN